MLLLTIHSICDLTDQCGYAQAVFPRSHNDSFENCDMSNNVFLKAVCRAMDRIAPLRLAASWDNVSLVSQSEQRRLTTEPLTGWFIVRYVFSSLDPSRSECHLQNLPCRDPRNIAFCSR